MPAVTQERLNTYRAATFRLRPELRLESQEDALAYVNERGFVYFWPIKGIEFPSLWTAVVGNRPVADKHDDPGHVTWGWKDAMLDKKLWYYAKVLRGKATMISLDALPHFYALSENYGAPEEDYLQLYEEGKLSREAKVIFETLLEQGPLDTVRLRREAHLTSKASNSPFGRGLTQLQRDFKILPIGVAEAGAWRYSFIYEVTHRYFPDLLEQARVIKRSEARAGLVRRYFDSVGAATTADVQKLFQWPRRDLTRTLAALIESGALLDGVALEGEKGVYLALPDLVG